MSSTLYFKKMFSVVYKRDDLLLFLDPLQDFKTVAVLDAVFGETHPAGSLFRLNNKNNNN